MTIDPNWTLLAIAGLNLATGILAWDARRAAKVTQAVATETKAIALKTEINTNSLTTRLAATSREAGHAEGREEARVEGEQKAVSLAAETKG